MKLELNKEYPQFAWDESLSPYRKVATIRSPAQRCDSPEHTAFCENISFNAWRTLPEHRPLGNINRARKEVYPVISRYRHQRNLAPLREPDDAGNYPNLRQSEFQQAASTVHL